ncbi:MAG: S8 family serine peptidase [Clostridiales bacterium]|nr:S8 family serine peptidase [Clostridiales bacterium]
MSVRREVFHRFVAWGLTFALVAAIASVGTFAETDQGEVASGIAMGEAEQSDEAEQPSEQGEADDEGTDDIGDDGADNEGYPEAITPANDVDDNPDQEALDQIMALMSDDEPDESAYDGYIVVVKPEEVSGDMAGAASEDPVAGNLFAVESPEEALEFAEPEQIIAIEPNFILMPLEFPQTAPEDPYYKDGLQWNLSGDFGVDALGAWSRELSGTGVRVAVIDSGIKEHEDMEPIKDGYRFGNSGTLLGTFAQGGYAVVDDDYLSTHRSAGHGTFVSSMVSAKTNNGVGIAGLAYGAEVVPYKVLGRTLNASFLDLAAALNHIAQHNEQNPESKIEVVNMSLGAASSAKPTSLQGSIDALDEQGVIMVASAGNGADNNTTNIMYPAGNDSVVGVASIDEDGIRADNSQTNDSVDIAAPGVLIYGLSYASPTSYRTMSGTSMAAPQVAAVAALAKEMDPDIDHEEFMDLLERTSKAPTDGDTGKTPEYGFGLLDAASLVKEYNRYTIKHSYDDVIDESLTVRGYAKTDEQSFTASLAMADVGDPKRGYMVESCTLNGVPIDLSLTYVLVEDEDVLVVDYVIDEGQLCTIEFEYEIHNDSLDGTDAEITATYDDAAIESGDVVFKGGELVVTVEAEGADAYAYAWAVDGEPVSADGASYSMFLGDGDYKSVEVFCKVRGVSLPAVITESLPDGKVGEEYNATLEATGTEPIEWGIAGGSEAGGLWIGGGMPGGLSLNSQTGEISGMPTAEGIFSFTAMAGNIAGDDTMELSIKIDAVPEPDMTATLSLMPSHAIIFDIGETAVFEAFYSADAYDPELVKWEAEGDAGDFITIDDSGKAIALVQATIDGLSEARTVRIRATYNEAYIATATVTLLPPDEGEDDGSPAVRLLATKATINLAKTEGTMVPLHITRRLEPPSGGGNGTYDVVFTGKGAESFTGFVRDSRFLEILAAEGTKKGTYKKIGVEINGVSAGTMTLAVNEKFPKIKIVTERLNLSRPEDIARVTATSNDGAICTVERIEVVSSNKASYVAVQGVDGRDGLMLTSTAKKGSVRVEVTVKAAGYERLSKNGSPTEGTSFRATVKIVNDVPRLRLSTSLLRMAGTAPATVRLESAVKKRALESWGAITAIRLAKAGELTASQTKKALGGIVLERTGKDAFAINFDRPEDVKAGTVFVAVDIDGGARPVILPLTMKTINPAKSTMTASPRSVAWNRNQPNETTPIALGSNQSNLVFEAGNIGVELVTGSGKSEKVGTLPLYIDIAERLDNQVVLSLNNGELEDHLGNGGTWPKGGKHRLRIADDATGKKVHVTLTIADRPASAIISLRGRIDIANPDSAITATVRLRNTTAPVRSVALSSSDFEARYSEGNTFAIMAGHRFVVPVKQSVTATITLENDEVLTRNINITPRQGTLRAWQSRSAVTLYKDRPLEGEQVGLKLRKPDGAVLGVVQIREASQKPFVGDGFRLERNGANDWSIYFAWGEPPIPAKGSKLASRYTVGIELWAEGTYRMEGGRAAPLRDDRNRAKTKPRIVNVRVNIR